MNFINWFMDFIIHFNVHLEALTIHYGAWIYAILFLVVFCETGLVVTPFLPGDSLLFITGTLAADGIGHLHIHGMIVLISVAAILGDACNYLIGKFLGKKLFRNPNSRIFKQSYLKKTHDFYEKYGGKTIILARFMPIVRTFAPFVAGMGRMNYTRFFIYNAVGGIVWVTLFLYTGYFFGRLDFIKNHLHILAAVIIAVSLTPGIIEIYRQRRKNNR